MTLRSRRRDDELTRLVARLSQEGVVVAGWWGEVKVPNVAQVLPDLLGAAVAGPMAADFIPSNGSGTPDPGAEKASCCPTGGC